MNEITLPHHHGPAVNSEIQTKLDDQKTFETVSDAFKLLDDVSRLRIFWLLCHCEQCVTNISAMTGMTSPAVSHHLKQLKAGGLIVSRREGKEVYYQAADNQQTQVLHHCMEQMMHITCPQR